MHMYAVFMGVREGASPPGARVSHQTWVLEMELTSSARAVLSLHLLAVSSPMVGQTVRQLCALRQCCSHAAK